MSCARTYPTTHTATRPTRRQLRLQYGGGLRTPDRSRRTRRATPSTSCRRHSHHSRHSRHSRHPKGGAVSDFAHTPYGPSWNAQSCWMDSSLMALFYPDAMFKVMYPLFARSTTSNDSHIRTTLLQIINEIRVPGGQPSLHGFRNMLATKTSMTGDQKFAFQKEHEFGYVFYFLQEIQKLFSVPCIRARPPYGKRYRRLYVLELEACGIDGTATVESCLAKTYRRWSFHPSSSTIRHLMIELLDEEKHRVQPQERMQFQGKYWSLCSMIVFDCSHFVSYVKQGVQWYLYDDTRAISHLELKPCEFGKHYYEKGGCRYQYGVQNTFFFYVVEG